MAGGSRTLTSWSRENSEARRFGNSLLKKVQPLPSDLRRNADKAGDIPTRPCKAGNQSPPNWIVIRIAHYDWDCSRRFLGNTCGVHALTNDGIHIETDKLSRKVRKQAGLAARKSPVNDKIFSFDVS